MLSKSALLLHVIQLGQIVLSVGVPRTQWGCCVEVIICTSAYLTCWCGSEEGPIAWSRDLVQRLLPCMSQAVLSARCMFPPRVLRSIHHLLNPAERGPEMCLRRRHVV